MRMFKKIVLSSIVILIFIELSLLSMDIYKYKKYKYAKLNPNGRIICQLDEWFNFGGFNTK